MYDDTEMGGMMELMPRANELQTEHRLLFLPFASGTQDLDMTGYSDFMIMADYLCSNLGIYEGPPDCGTIDLLE